jgi:hypothetical protein
MQDKIKWSYLAAMIDGEGSICVTKCLKWAWTNIARTNKKKYVTYSLFIQVTNKSEKLMKWLVTNFGGVYYPKSRKTHEIQWAQAWDWHIKGNKNKKTALLSILPYLVVKNAQAKLALEWVDLGDCQIERREEIRNQMCALNRRGPSTTNTLDTSEDEVKIESEPNGDIGRDPTVTLES